MEFFSAETASALALVMAIFWVAYVLLRVFLFTPVQALLEDRAQDIRSAQQIHDLARFETDADLDSQRARLADARAQARSRRDEVRRDAQLQRAELLAGAKKVAGEKLAAAQEDLDAQVAAARQQLERQAQQLASQMTDRLLGRAS